jgi:hypothetical protein
MTRRSLLDPMTRRQLMSASPALVLMPAFALQGRGNSPAQQRDAILAALAAEMVGAVKTMDTQPAAALSTMATSLRVLASHGQAQKLEQDFDRQLKALIRSKGKAQLASEPLDLTMAVAELRANGVNVDLNDPRLRQATDVQLRINAIDALLAKGLRKAWREQADHLAELAATARPVALVRQANCEGMAAHEALLEWTAGVSCLLAPFWGPELCAIATANWLGYKFYAWMYGCYI